MNAQTEIDDYDKQIQLLTAQPELIGPHWFAGKGLFKFVGNTRNAGCLTMIKGGRHEAIINDRLDYELTQQIRNDDNLPSCAAEIKILHLPTFAKWQRHIDKLQAK